MQRKLLGSPLRAWVVAGIFGAVTLTGGAAAVVTLQARAAVEPEAVPRPALTVSVTPLRMVDHYLEQESYVGRVEPARETAPAAERAGLLTEILVDEGDAIEEGQVLARLDLRPLEITRTRLIAERASLDADIELARLTTDRRARLVDEGWASGQAYDEARLSIIALEARREAVEAQISQIALDIEKSVITAPFAGRVSARLVDEGTVVAAGTALLRLQETARPQARIGVPSDRVDGFRAGDALVLRAQARDVAGQLVAISPDLDPGTRTVPLLVDLDPNASLVMGQVIRLHLDRQVEARGAWVALTALREAERGLWSLMTVVEENGHEVVRREAVEILHVHADRAFVRGTFADGAQTVSSGAHRVSDGMIVTRQPEG